MTVVPRGRTEDSLVGRCPLSTSLCSTLVCFASSRSKGAKQLHNYISLLRVHILLDKVRATSNPRDVSRFYTTNPRYYRSSDQWIGTSGSAVKDGRMKSLSILASIRCDSMAACTRSMKLSVAALLLLATVSCERTNKRHVRTTCSLLSSPLALKSKSTIAAFGMNTCGTPAYDIAVRRVPQITFTCAPLSAVALPPPWRRDGALGDSRSPCPSTLKFDEPDGQVLASTSRSCLSAKARAEIAVPSQKEVVGDLLSRLSAFSRRVAVRVSSWSIA